MHIRHGQNVRIRFSLPNSVGESKQFQSLQNDVGECFCGKRPGKSFTHAYSQVAIAWDFQSMSNEDVQPTVANRNWIEGNVAIRLFSNANKHNANRPKLHPRMTWSIVIYGCSEYKQLFDAKWLASVWRQTRMCLFSYYHRILSNLLSIAKNGLNSLYNTLFN